MAVLLFYINLYVNFLNMYTKHEFKLKMSVTIELEIW